MGFTAALLHPRHWLTWLGIAVACLVTLLPRAIRDRLAWMLARLSFNPQNKRLRFAQKNIAHCFQELDTAAHQQLLWRYHLSLVQNLLFVPRLWYWPESLVRKQFEVRGQANLDQAIGRTADRHTGQTPGQSRKQHHNNGAIVMVTHCMPLEFIGSWLSMGYELHSIYKPFKNPVWEWLIHRTRTRFGSWVYPRGQSMLTIVKACKRGGLVGYIGDEDYGENQSVFAPFFGQPKATLVALPRLARLCRAPVVPAYAHYDASQGKVVIHCDEALQNFPSESDLENATIMNAAMERCICRAPEQFLWKMRFFNTSEDGGESIYLRKKVG